LKRGEAPLRLPSIILNCFTLILSVEILIERYKRGEAPLINKFPLPLERGEG
jgi:hypothetical protein